MSELQVRLRMGAYFFVQYFMLGVWFVSLGTYMSKSLGFDSVIGWAYAAQGVAALIASPFAGAIADRWVGARSLLTILMAISAVSLFGLSMVRESEVLFLALVLIHFLAFVPTIPLTNAVCLNGLIDPERQFARIRVFGTLGWIAGGMVIGAIPGALLTPLPIQLASAAGILLAIGAYVLPELAATARPEPLNLVRALGLDAISRIRNRSFWAVCSCAAILSLPLAFYNAYCNNFLQESGAVVTVLGRTFEPTAIQALGQVSELGFLLALPLFLRLVGIGGVLVIGTIGWILRAAFFATGYSGIGDASLVPLLAGILLHGVCYDFIMIGAALFVDRAVDPAARSRAQSFLTMITMGAGISIGSILANPLYNAATISDNAHDWSLMWASVGGVAIIALVIFLEQRAAYRLRSPKAARLLSTRNHPPRHAIRDSFREPQHPGATIVPARSCHLISTAVSPTAC